MAFFGKTISEQFSESALRLYKNSPRSGVISVPEILVNDNEILTKASTTADGVPQAPRNK
jgi:hypothetical protein